MPRKNIKKKKKKTHRLAILLDSIKFPNNFVFKNSNNFFKSNKTTKFNKKTHLKPPCLCIVRFTDTIQFIWYASMYQTIHEHLRYEIFCTQYDTYRMIYIAYRTMLTAMSTRDLWIQTFYSSFCYLIYVPSIIICYMFFFIFFILILAIL